MLILPQRCMLAILVVVDVAIHARMLPVTAKSLAIRHHLSPRYLENLLHTLGHAQILKGLRGPKGGYVLAKERRRITLAEIIRIVLLQEDSTEAAPEDLPALSPISQVVEPIIAKASCSLLESLAHVTIEDVYQRCDSLIEGVDMTMGAYSMI